MGDTQFLVREAKQLQGPSYTTDREGKLRMDKNESFWLCAVVMPQWKPKYHVAMSMYDVRRRWGDKNTCIELLHRLCLFLFVLLREPSLQLHT